jgi:hypothetical protein
MLERCSGNILNAPQWLDVTLVFSLIIVLNDISTIALNYNKPKEAATRIEV